MEDISDIARDYYIWSFYIDIKNKDFHDFKKGLKDNEYYLNLIHPDYRNFDVLSIDQIAQIFFDNRDKVKHIFSKDKLQNYERLLCFKDKTESKLISHLINIKVAVERLYEKFQDAVRMRADVTEVKMLLKSIGKLQAEDDEDICENCSIKTSITCYIDILLFDYDIIISEKQLLDSEVLLKTAKLLVQAGGKVNDHCDPIRPPYYRSPPLVRAASQPNTELALFLIENGAHVNIINTTGYRYQPLCLAVENCNSIRLVEKIIEKGADLDAINGQITNVTALHKACYFGNENAIELLIRKGADITLRDFQGKTPFAILIHNRLIKPKFSSKIIFVKEIAKAKIENRNVSPEDLKIIKKDPNLNDLYKKCCNQLNKLNSTLFYLHFSYIDVLNMRNKNARKLVKLLRNENFIHYFAVNLSSDILYNKDLMINFAEAEIIRRKYDKLESILKSTIGKHLSSDLLMYIIDFIEVQDLSLFTDREF